MKILFISYAGISLQSGARSFSLVCALADAGYSIDIIAPFIELPDHPNFHVFAGTRNQPYYRHRLWLRCMQAIRSVSYDAVHATDEAAFFAMRVCRWARLPLIYDASRRFSKLNGNARGLFHRLFPAYVRRLESKVMKRSNIILTPCGVLSAELNNLDKESSVVQLHDVPLQSLVSRSPVDKTTLLESLDVKAGPVVVCSILPNQKVGFRNLLMAARKVVDSVPDALFLFEGIEGGSAQKMAINLDIMNRCIFLQDDQTEMFLSALDVADAALFVPQDGSRYTHAQIYTLLQSQAPVVAVHESAYDNILNESNSVRVLETPDSIADGILRVIREPLFSQAIAVEGQELVASKHTYSSFKHKVRMTYHQLFKQE